jgi:hypothetical protein
VTPDKTEAMVNFNKVRSEKNEELVFNAVSILGSALPHIITKYIQNEVIKAASDKFYVNVDQEEINNYVKINSIHIRTVRRKLKELVEDGKVVKKSNGEYAVSDLALSDLRFFARKDAVQFGGSVLGSILSLHYPTVFNMKDNLKSLVEMLGFYVLYCSLEATRPVPDIKKKPNDYLSKVFKDKLAVDWLDKVFDARFILDACFSALTNQLSDQEVTISNKNHMIHVDDDTCIYKNNPEDDFKGPPSTQYFHMKRFLYIYSKRGHLDYRKKKTPPLYEIDKNSIAKIGKILQELYPLYYRYALEARAMFLGRPKESSLRNRNDMFRSFED